MGLAGCPRSPPLLCGVRGLAVAVMGSVMVGENFWDIPGIEEGRFVTEGW